MKTIKNIIKVIFLSVTIVSCYNYTDKEASTSIENAVNKIQKNANLLDTAKLKIDSIKPIPTIKTGTEVGLMAPNFVLPDVNGKLFMLNSLKGKYVLLDFWASWCGPCRYENPNVVANYTKFKNKNFTILGVSLDEDKDAWLAAIKKDKLTWTHVSDLKGWGNAAARLYGVESIPFNVLLDTSGKIIAKDLRDSDLGKKLSEVLAK